MGTLKPELGADQESYSPETISHRRPEPLERRLPTIHRGRLVRRKIHREKQSPTYLGPLTHPTIVGKEIVCVTPPNGVQSFNTESNDWTNRPPLLGAAASEAVSSNRNLVVQTKDSIQIFSIDVLASRDVHDHVHLSHIYPLSKEYILRLQQDRRPALFSLETLQELYPDDGTSPFGSVLHDLSPSAHTLRHPGLVAYFDFTKAIRLWKKRTPIREGSGLAHGQMSRALCALFPGCTTVLTVAAGFLWVTDAKSGVPLAMLHDNDLGGGEVYDIALDSETRFYLKVEGPD